MKFNMDIFGFCIFILILFVGIPIGVILEEKSEVENLGLITDIKIEQSKDLLGGEPTYTFTLNNNSKVIVCSFFGIRGEGIRTNLYLCKQGQIYFTSKENTL